MLYLVYDMLAWALFAAFVEITLKELRFPHANTTRQRTMSPVGFIGSWGRVVEAMCLLI